ncbi:MAG: leucyl/phenylalanyl-tRNA--protein transferase [Desulfovibrionales bacterium]|nr:leucyl/phenylalanyl-tRNA--protein transferase [Desulfovibrionales bacterium]
MTVFHLSAEPVFPHPSHADADGLLAVGGDLSPQRLLRAYSMGIFPWYTEHTPILWWSPEPRCILEPGGLHVPARLKRLLRQQPFRITLDTAFDQVMTHCARTPRSTGQGTWIVPEMQAAYSTLHSLGFAHSVEVWNGTTLAGGVYGLALGRAFFGESMFYHQPNASKIGVVTLVRLLEQAGYSLVDCQQTTAHMQRFGGFAVSRTEFLHRLDAALAWPTQRGQWSIHDNQLKCLPVGR